MRDKNQEGTDGPHAAGRQPPYLDSVYPISKAFKGPFTCKSIFISLILKLLSVRKLTEQRPSKRSRAAHFMFIPMDAFHTKDRLSEGPMASCSPPRTKVLLGSASLRKPVLSSPGVSDKS